RHGEKSPCSMRLAPVPSGSPPGTLHTPPGRHIERNTMELRGSMNMIGYGRAAIGSAIGVGLIFAAYINGVARQPESQSQLQPITLLGFAVAEALAILCLVFVFVIKAGITIL